jgi:hypothetical protein
MFSRIASVLLVISLITSMVSFARAYDEIIVNFVLPPSSSATLSESSGDTALINDNESYQKSYAISNSSIYIDQDFFGARVAMPSYYVYFRPGAEVSVREELELTRGSIWVKALKGGDDFHIQVGPLVVTSSEGEFLLYISPAHDDIAVKTLEGIVSVHHGVTGQNVVMEKEYMTQIDGHGYLIAPLPFEPELIPKWWEFEDYEESRSIPVANAGEDQYVLDGSSITLNGLTSTFNDGDIFEWTLVEGPVSEVIYDTTDITRPVFTPPAPGVYRFSLSILSGEGIRSESDTVRIFVGENYLSSVDYFDDVSSDDPKSIAINYLRKHGVIRGYKDEVSGKSLFYPKSPVTRAQVLKVFFLGSNIDVPDIDENDDTGFVDVSADQWYAKYVKYAKDEGIIKGNPDGKYRPDQPVNRAAALKIALEINNVDVESSNRDITFSDVPYDSWFAFYMAFAYEHQLFDPDDDFQVRPDAEMTRDEVADLMYRLIKRGLVGSRGRLSGFVVQADGEAVSDAQVQVYTTKESSMIATSDDEDPHLYLEADVLLRTVETDEAGSFLITLPVGLYSVQVASDDGFTEKSFIVEVQNQKNTSVMLETSQ